MSASQARTARTLAEQVRRPPGVTSRTSPSGRPAGGGWCGSWSTTPAALSLDLVAVDLAGHLRALDDYRRPGRGPVRAGGHLTRRRPPADVARHWVRAVGRLVEVTLHGRRTLVGRVHPGRRRQRLAGRRRPHRELRAGPRAHAQWSRSSSPGSRTPSSRTRAAPTSRTRADMDIDMAALRAVAIDKEISIDLLVDSIEQALLVAYQHTPGAAASARVELDQVDRARHGLGRWRSRPRTSAEGFVPARVRRHPGGLRPGGLDDRPAGARAAAARGRGRRHPRPLLRAGSGTWSPGWSSRAATRGWSSSTSGGSRASCRPRSPWPRRASRTAHGSRRWSWAPGATPSGVQVVLSRTHPGLVRALFALEVPEIADGSVEIVALAREAGHRTKMAVRSHRAGLNPKGACIGPMGARVRNVMAELGGEKIDIVDWSDDPAEMVAQRAVARRGSARCTSSTPRPAQRTRDRAGLPAVAGDRQGGPERPPGRPADRLADRHPVRTPRR